MQYTNACLRYNGQTQNSANVQFIRSPIGQVNSTDTTVVKCCVVTISILFKAASIKPTSASANLKYYQGDVGDFQILSSRRRDVTGACENSGVNQSWNFCLM